MKTLTKTICILFGLITTAPALAIPISTVGSLDTKIANTGNTEPANSGDATEEAWVESLLGFDVSYVTRTNSNNAVAVDGLSNTYAQQLVGTPDYFLIKIGTGGISALSHVLFENKDKLTYAAFTLSDLGLSGSGNQKIDRLSHISEFNSSNISVPEPATLALLISGLALISWSARRRQDHT